MLQGKDVNLESVKAELEALEQGYRARSKALKALIRVLEAEAKPPHDSETPEE